MKNPYIALSAGLTGTLTAALLGISTPLHAAGLAISNQGAVGMGNAYAGAGASASDASTAWANPAGMMELVAPTAAFAATVTLAESDFTNNRSTLNPALGAGPVTGIDTTDQSSTRFIPNFYYARPMNDKYAIGLSISAPFGASSDYDPSWVGRYHATETLVSAIDINPTVAYKISDKVTIAGGISVILADAKLGNAIDSGASCFGLGGRGLLPTIDCIEAGLTPPNTEAQDSSVEINGSDTAISFNIAALFKPNTNTRIGVAYRHGSDLELEGDANFTVNPALAGVLAANTFPIFSDTDSTVSGSLPSTLDLSVSRQYNQKVELLGSLLWTQWSAFDKLVVDFTNPAQSQAQTTFDWKDVVRVSAGFNYYLNNKTTLRAGVAFDQSPIPSALKRSPRGPANDRFWYSAGASYQINTAASVHVGLSHVQIDSSAIDNTGDSPGAPTLRGEFDQSANLAGIQFNWNF